MNIKADLVKALFLAANNKLSLRLVSRIEIVHVIRGAGFTVRPNPHNTLRRSLRTVFEIWQAQRIIARAEDGVIPRRQIDGPSDIMHGKPGAARSAIGNIKLCREELFQEADIAGDDQDAGNPYHAAAAARELQFIAAGQGIPVQVRKV